MIVKEKLNQAIEILNDLKIDMWLIFCRESTTIPDPSIPLVVGHNIVGQSAFLITKNGDTIAIVSGYDAADFINSGVYKEVISYKESISDELLQKLYQHNPGTIAINYSKGSVSADGLTHGMYLLLTEYLTDTPYLNKLVSAEKILFSVRGRKNRFEIDHLKKAAVIADQCWHMSIPMIEPGMTEIQIAALIANNLQKLGSRNSFNPIVNAGAKTSPGHGSPTDAVLEEGDLLHIDFGALVEGYCSDIQRVAYFRRKGEISPPEPLLRAFDKIKSIIDVTSKEYKTGALGFEIDGIARKMLRDNGYEEYNHCLGHQIGREVHDGASLVGPSWKRYGEAPRIPLEANNTFTAELGISLPGIGYVSLEEDLMVTDEGGVFLGPRQTELIIK
ncbi:M24 family metallopeptidase [bacterium]|nr:M24 family metallopeptidase [bacterium]